MLHIFSENDHSKGLALRIRFYQCDNHLELVTYFFYGNFMSSWGCFMLTQSSWILDIPIKIHQAPTTSPLGSWTQQTFVNGPLLEDLTHLMISPGAPGMVCWTPKKNTQQSLLNKTGSHWKVTEIRSEIVILNPQDWIPYCRSLMDINGLYGRSTTSWWGFVQKFLAVLSFIFSMLSSNSGRKMVIFVGGYLIKMMVLNDKSICECPWL